MHTLHRLLFITALLLSAVTITLGGSAVAYLTRDEAQERFSVVLDQARDGYRESATAGISAGMAKQTLEATSKSLMTLATRNRELRLQIAAVRRRIAGMETEADALIRTELRSVIRMQSERERLAGFARGGFVRYLVADSGTSPARLFTRRIFGESMGESTDEELRSQALSRAQAQLLLSMLHARDTSLLSQANLNDAAGEAGAELTKLETERARVLKEYKETARRHASAEAQLQISEEQMAEIRQETMEVQSEILRMQGDMAQIEARLRARAERELIQKGLRTAQPGRYREQAGTASFLWPANGTHTAGFQNESYLAYFGVPHNGIDIAVGQGTEVAASADGIVFLARDGGARGFSYILIGHRNGYATLYGHLSSFSVTTGQEVRQGQIIGLSGGRPGTHGAGPMTTGAHLHFEVIKNGVHVDPESVLP